MNVFSFIVKSTHQWLNLLAKDLHHLWILIHMDGEPQKSNHSTRRPCMPDQYSFIGFITVIMFLFGGGGVHFNL